jgi:hypothetical protein
METKTLQHRLNLLKHKIGLEGMFTVHSIGCSKHINVVVTIVGLGSLLRNLPGFMVT